jgi:hypothetical protein
MYALSSNGQNIGPFYFSKLIESSLADCVGRCNTVDANAGGFEETIRGR